MATKTGKQGPELVSRVAELEAENAGQARQMEELRVALEEVQQQAKEKILEEKRKAKQVGSTVEVRPLGCRLRFCNVRRNRS